MTRLLADHTTIGVGGPARNWLEPATETELIEAVAAADGQAEPVLVLGGGSNLVVSDAGFDGTVVATRRLRGIQLAEGPGGVLAEVAAGEPWDEFVAAVVADGFAGVEALSGIPGLVGSSPVQNVGAYGQEVAESIRSVRVYDRLTQQQASLVAGECGFGYRSSRFKAEPGRWLVLSVSFELSGSEVSTPVRYAELARRLGIDVGQRAGLEQVRAAVLDLRRSKAMVLDPADPDTRSSGSFFTNPLLEDANAVPAGAPSYPQPDGRVKTSAAWLIQHAGFEPGHGDGQARLSTKHTLAITNRGQATAADVMELAREVRDGVFRAFNVWLTPEPVLIGLCLEP